MASNKSLRLKQFIISSLSEFMVNCGHIKPIGEYIYITSSGSSDFDIDRVGVYTEESQMIEEVEKYEGDPKPTKGWKIHIDDVNRANLFEKQHPEYDHIYRGQYEDGDLYVCFDD